MNGEERAAIAALRVEIRHLNATVGALDEKVARIEARLNSWKGAGWMVLCLAGLAGGLGGDFVRKLFWGA